ncbi:hypothetical protein P4123_17175 [Pseudomonas aeruginosa]|nr:hypothetical protein [Pseudomonas aeruginosa]
MKNTLATNSQLGSNGDTKINIKGDDTAIGYNVGVIDRPDRHIHSPGA